MSLSVIAQYVMNGAMLGMMYALVAVGFTYGDLLAEQKSECRQAAERCGEQERCFGQHRAELSQASLGICLRRSRGED